MYKNVYLFYLFCATLSIQCKTRNTKQSIKSETRGPVTPENVKCGSSFPIFAYLQSNLNNKQSCFKEDASLGKVGILDPKRKLSPWIPCNKVTYYTHAKERENFSESNDDIMNYLTTSNRVSPQIASDVLTHSKKHLIDPEGNPILERPIAKAIREVIQGAKRTLFLDAFLLGGTWGMDIAFHLFEAAKQGKKVLIVRDTANSFGLDAIIDPVWNELLKWNDVSPNFAALQSDIFSSKPSGLPFGLEAITRFIPSKKLPLSPLGKSDHSKVLIADGLSSNPTVFLGSKNLIDIDGGFNFDESVVVKGPLAAIIQHAYTPDITLALDMALSTEVTGKTYPVQPSVRIKNNGPAHQFVKNWLQSHKEMAEYENGQVVDTESTWNSRARMAENNGNDSIRSLEHNILSLIKSAKKSIYLYGYLAYNPSLAHAISSVVVENPNIEIKILLDSGAPTSKLNLALGNFLMNSEAAKAGIWKDSQALPLKWRKTQKNLSLPVTTQEPISISQQQHTKTLIVDERLVLLGSGNFDMATASGAFREMSVVFDDPALAAPMVNNFKSIYSNPKQTAPYTDPAYFAQDDMAKLIQELQAILIEKNSDRINLLNAAQIKPGSHCGF